MNNKIWVILGVVVVVLVCVVYSVFLNVFSIGEETSGSHSPNHIIIASSSLFEKEIEVRIFDNGTVECYRERYYPWYKEIEVRRGYVSREEVEKLLELFSKLADYGEYIDKVSDEFIKEGHILEPIGNIEISCPALNKTLEISFRPPDFPGPETITPEAEEILAILDKTFLEAEVVEMIKKENSS
ncbi:MAG: hypothetical protein QXZ25_03725 [Candidatus Bathyarchaeia archaeon]